jgi:hypothetical protein
MNACICLSIVIQLRVAVRRSHLLINLGGVPSASRAAAFRRGATISTRTDSSDQACRRANDEAMRRDIGRDDRPRTDHRPGADGDPRKDYRTRAKGCTHTDTRFLALPVIVGFQFAKWSNRAGQTIVRENHMRPDEDAFFDDAPMIEAGIVLYLDSIADLDAAINEHPFAETTFVANTRGITHVCMMPDAYS